MTANSLDLSPYLDACDAQIRAAVQTGDPLLARFYAMLHYHLGWADEQFRPAHVNSGKRLRPLFCLLVCEALSGQFQSALPAAAAIEILHNFSLVHDDIEDGDRTRRHRPTLWTLVGVPHAVNAGDALFALAQRELLRLVEHGVSAERTLRASLIFQETCVQLVEGQYLDMHGESMAESSLAYYLRMIAGKTAALLGAATAIGAAVATDDAQIIADCRAFGVELGLAFQMTDDILGLWGQPEATGKPAGADLKRKKQSLPVVLSHASSGTLAERLRVTFAHPEVSNTDAHELLALMDATGIREQSEAEAAQHHRAALAHWQPVAARGVASPQASELLLTLTDSLTRRTY